MLNFLWVLSDKRMETFQVFIKTEVEDDREENVADNEHLLPRETPCQEPIKSERYDCDFIFTLLDIEASRKSVNYMLM
jgi:hypothetical protein